MDGLILDPRDSSTVPAALGLLALLASGQLVSPGSLARLIGWMEDAPPGRFAAGMPQDVRVARALGETPEDLGFTAATAELAIATFPGDRRYALAAFLVGSTATEAAARPVRRRREPGRGRDRLRLCEGLQPDLPSPRGGVEGGASWLFADEAAGRQGGSHRADTPTPNSSPQGGGTGVRRLR